MNTAGPEDHRNHCYHDFSSQKDITVGNNTSTNLIEINIDKQDKELREGNGSSIFCR